MQCVKTKLRPWKQHPTPRRLSWVKRISHKLPMFFSCAQNWDMGYGSKPWCPSVHTSCWYRYSWIMLDIHPKKKTWQNIAHSCPFPFETNLRYSTKNLRRTQSGTHAVSLYSQKKEPMSEPVTKGATVAMIFGGSLQKKIKVKLVCLCYICN